MFLTAFIVIELKVAKPLVNLRLLKQRNFGIGVLANVLVGFALFGSVYILPQYLGQVQHYNAEQIGNVLAWTGLPQLILIPMVPMLMKRFDVRYIACLGIAIFAASCFMNTSLSFDSAGDQFFLPNIVRAIGQALVITPVSAVTTAGILPKDAGAASGLSNMMRNLGGAVGTATLGTILDKARAVPLEHHRPIDHADARRGAEPSRPDDVLLHGAWRVGSCSRDRQGHCRARRGCAAASADHGLQRRLRCHWRPARHRRRLDAPRPQAAGRRRSGRPLTGVG